MRPLNKLDQLNSIDVNIEIRHPNAKLPIKANLYDGGADLVAIDIKFTEQYIEYSFGLAMEIPEGCVGLIYPRSSISKYDLILCNSVGVIDYGFNGTVTARFKKTNGDDSKIYDIGDRIAQLIVVPIPQVRYNEVTSISGNRSGYGSTGA